mmetsp:Transcript_81507/g.230963  ORF Transcript_81507/g.230963 Transcript_81507/m.230963 type:complete len:216 (+) Transcript_81507:340-987(+)
MQRAAEPRGQVLQQRRQRQVQLPVGRDPELRDELLPLLEALRLPVPQFLCVLPSVPPLRVPRHCGVAPAPAAGRRRGRLLAGLGLGLLPGVELPEALPGELQVGGPEAHEALLPVTDEAVHGPDRDEPGNVLRDAEEHTPPRLAPLRLRRRHAGPGRPLEELDDDGGRDVEHVGHLVDFLLVVRLEAVHHRCVHRVLEILHARRRLLYWCGAARP